VTRSRLAGEGSTEAKARFVEGYALQPAPDRLQPRLEREERPGDATQQQCAEHDEQRAARRHGGGEVGVGQRCDVQGADHERDEAEGVGHGAARPVRQPPAQRHPEP
jgi:hypothetical protein